MSWLFSRVLVEGFSAAGSWDGGLSAPSNGSPTPQVYSSPDKTTACLSLSRFGMTCRPLTESRGAELLTLYRAAFPVRTSAPLARAKASKAHAQECGERWPASLARYDRGTSSWRTAQLSLLGDLAAFSATWPRSGLMLGGTCWELPTLAPAIGESESGFVPTVLTSEAIGPGLHGNGSHTFRTWFRANSTERRLPLHGEIMMLWPEGWANLGASLATDKFQQWQQQHGACLVGHERQAA